ncbi:hypothetical protein EXIGLDRAFT_847688 [Exidia glandulosa HHB12029]|uniref:MYND-type domain-containing protein n=1 Tax=Exidia glandulosa HHB12029 TaxID=1314781 RepID=A0A166MQ00_EXIGL|nr:hypothetical protein EXIGLDRAFT_847688 [Exidia glandulosa HHB12029]
MSDSEYASSDGEDSDDEVPVLTQDVDAWKTDLEAAKKIGSSLQDATRPTGCPVCLLAFAEHLTTDKTNVRGLLTHVHSFWDGCVAAVTRPRSKNAMRVLRAAMQRNSNECDEGEHSTSDDLASQFLDAACQIVYAGLAHIMSRASQQKRTFSSLRHGYTLWPQTRSELFPVEPAEAIAALISCAEVVGRTSGYPLLVLGTYMMVARAQVLPVFMQSAALRQRVVQVVADTLTNASSAPTRAQPFMSAGLFLYALREGPGAKPDDPLDFVIDFKDILFPALCTGFDAGKSNTTDAVGREYFLPALRPYILRLHAVMRLPVASLPLTIQPEVQRNYKMQFVNILYVLLGNISRTRRCAHKRCPAPDAGAFKTCSACHLLRYCNVQCQRDDWNGRGYNVKHKDVCPLLARILPTADPDGPELAFIHAYTAATANFSVNETGSLAYYAFEHELTPLELKMRFMDMAAEKGGNVPGFQNPFDRVALT